MLAAFLYEEDEIYYQEIALYKLSTKIFLKGDLVEKIIIRKYGAKILKIEKDHIIIQKTGTKVGTQKLYDELKKFGEICYFAFITENKITAMKRRNIFAKLKIFRPLEYIR